VRILYAHNFYRMPGGEDEIFADEIRLMRQHGHEVGAFESSSKTLATRSKLAAGIEGVWSTRMADAIRARIRAERPDVVHVHNSYPVMSPAIFRAAAAEGAAVVHTLHNYRMLCSHAGLYRAGRICEDCVGAVAPWRGVLHGCNHNGRAADTQIAVAVGVHRLFGTWRRSIDRYIALTPFARDIYVRGGLPASKIAVLPTYVEPDPGIGPGGEHALFVGRFTVEKGIRVILDAWRHMDGAIPLKIVGSGGPLADETAAAARGIPGVEFKGRVSREELTDLMQRARFLVFPSIWYEGTPRTIAEAFAAGTPVVSSDIGAMRLMVTPGRDGDWFCAGDPDDLARTIRALIAEPGRLSAMRAGARRTFESTYAADRHYDGLLSIYRDAIHEREGIAARS
jgi:glycosyltransferase involved in cell wall biosynthesis